MQAWHDPGRSTHRGTGATRERPRRELWDDISGVTWHVSEHAAPPHLADRCTYCLVFDSPQVVRRVCGQGADWHRLPDTALLALVRAPR